MDTWADIPIDIMLRIFKRLAFVDDIIVARAVCKSWRLSATLQCIQTPPNVPWLMLAEKTKWGLQSDKLINKPRRFFNLRDNKIYHMKLPETMGRKCRTIGFGWILTIGLDLQINLVHPLFKLRIDLPPESSFVEPLKSAFYNPKRVRYIKVQKAVASNNPWDTEAKHPNKDCVIMAIYGQYGHLAFTRPGDKAWIDVQTPHRRFSDIIYYQEKFYGVDQFHIYTCNNISNNLVIPMATRIAHIPSWIRIDSQKYIVESLGELLLVCRTYDQLILADNSLQNVTYRFEVLKLKKKEESTECLYDHELVEVEGLDGQALFIGDNASFSLSPSSLYGCQGNCIYFTDNHEVNYFSKKGSGSDMGVYNLEDGSIIPHYTGQSLSYFCSPFWYM
ncbi:hypothetical protein ACFE04_015761 [Oxalis oulophora]